MPSEPRAAQGSKKELEKVVITMRAGSAYVLTGEAQGATNKCAKRCTGHKQCGCCWSHGVRVSKETISKRQSMTMRVLADSDDEEDEDDEEEDEDDEEEDKGGGGAEDGAGNKGDEDDVEDEEQ